MTFINNTFKTSIMQMTPDQAVDSIRDIAKGIRETSAKIRETIKTLRRSGAIDEFTQAVHEATLATYSATKTKEINETSKDLKERGIINDRANAMEETIMVTRGTLGIERNTTYEMAEAAPKSRERLQKGSEPVKQKMRKRTSKIKAKRRE
jgi:DNA-binding Lrp family transcriptional regulator